MVYDVIGKDDKHKVTLISRLVTLNKNYCTNFPFICFIILDILCRKFRILLLLIFKDYPEGVSIRRDGKHHK